MRRLLLLTLALAACDKPAPSPEPKQTYRARTAAPAPQAAEPSAGQQGAADDAAGTLRRYYGFIEKGDYSSAYRMRSGGTIDPERFAANFKAYESYRSQVGTPSLPVASGGWDYVEVPVMTTGRLLGGKPFGSSGSVTLRRARNGPDRGWRIYTG